MKLNIAEDSALDKSSKEEIKVESVEEFEANPSTFKPKPKPMVKSKGVGFAADT